MGRNVAIGIQNYNEIIENHYFYVDKTNFIKQWWESGDSVTLITRPRRFGKTLTMSMVEQFFSLKYAGRSDLFEGLAIWEENRFHKIQGSYPVLSLSFANIKETDYKTAVYRICQLLKKLYEQHAFLRECDLLSDAEKAYFNKMAAEMDEVEAPMALYQLSDFLYRYYGKKVIILLDEYDTPMQEAYIAGFWDKLAQFTSSSADDAIIIEFKVFNAKKEKTLEDTLKNALQQIEDKKYDASLRAKGIERDRIRKYGFAFEGKTVLIG